MTLQVVEIIKEDLDELLEIENTLYKSPWKKEDYLYELNDNPFAYYFKLIDKDTKEILGYIGFWIKFEFAEITKVSIKKKYQGHKLSKILMEDSMRRMQLADCVNVTLEVRNSNKIAYNLYSSCGFKQVAVRKKYYSDGEDALLMLKEFNHDNISN